MSEPLDSLVGPEIVPEPSKSPGPILQPIECSSTYTTSNWVVSQLLSNAPVEVLKIAADNFLGLGLLGSAHKNF
jgi:hypothetical protein